MDTDDAAPLPPIHVEPTSAPFELPVTHKTCPDCAKGIAAPGITYPRDPLRPVEEFFAQKAKRYEREQRYSAYCKPHQRQRNNAYRQNAKHAKGEPDAGERRAHAEEQQAWAARTGYEQKPERVAQRRKNFKRWREQNPDREKERVQRWHHDHQAQHAETALRSYYRRRGRRRET